MDGEGTRTESRGGIPPVIAALVAAALVAASRYSYLLFHTLAELFAIFVSLAIFIFAWNTRRRQESFYFPFLGIAYLHIALLDLIHTFCYEGMSILPGLTGSNHATQMWIGTRLLEAATLLAAPGFLGRTSQCGACWILYGIATLGLPALVFGGDILPVAYLHGTGQTPFKIAAEYGICVMLLVAIRRMYHRRKDFDPGVFRLLTGSIATTIAAELSFTLYVDPYGWFNLIGHLLKIVSFYLIYEAVLETGLRRPTELLFRKLKHYEDQLEVQLAERTRELQEHVDELQLAVNTAGFGIWKLHLDTGRLEWSESQHRIYGMEPGRFDQRLATWRAAIHPDDRVRAEQQFEGTRRDDEETPIEFRIIRPDGETRRVLAAVRTLEGPEGRPAALFGINLDITPLKRAEAAVLEGERRIETLIGNLTGMVYRCRNEHGWPMEFVSRGALPLTGWEPEAFLRSEVRYEDLIHPEDREHVWREVQSAVQRRSDFLLYYRIVTRSGQTRYVVEQGLAGESGAADGKAAALEGYIMDITARKELEAALDESEAQLRFVSDHAPVFIAHYDTDKRYKFVNQPYADLYGLPATALIGRRVGEVLDDATREIIEPHMDRALAGQLISFDYTPETATGGRRTFNVKYVPERNPDGAVVGFVAAISDISARVQAETELRQARDQLEERVKERTAELMAARNRAEVADRMKSLFLATMSHELRTPLNAISGFSSTLLKELPGPLNQEQRQQMRFIRQGADHLLALINDILDISKIEAGHIELKPQTFDLADHLRGWAHSLRNKMEQLGLALRLDFPPGPVEVTSDPRRLRQIVLNLLTNAMKFTHEGHIEVALVVPPSPPGTNPDGPVSIRVTDTGGGIAPADQERIFEPFVQGHTAPASNRRRGTGLGLSISRQLAERMGGTLTLERTGDQGTTFLLQLPRHLGEDPVRTHPHQS